MDVRKLYSIILDIVNEEEIYNINQQLELLISSLEEISSDLDSSEYEYDFNVAKERITDSLNKSKLNDLTTSNQKILITIGAEKYIGLSMARTIEEILSDSSLNILSITENLSNLKTERAKKFSTYRALNENFKLLNLTTHSWTNDKYEIGLLFPLDTTMNHEVPVVCKKLNKWNNIFKDINEIAGKESGNINISFVDNGSLEFFFDNIEITATIIITAIERLAALYKKILEIRKIRLELKKFNFPQSEQKGIEEHEKITIEKEIKEIRDTIFKDYGKKKFEEGRRNELKNALELHLKYIAKELDKGVVVEINPPDISNFIIPDGQSEEAKKIIEEYNKKREIITNITSKTREINRTNFIKSGVFKYLKSPEE